MTPVPAEVSAGLDPLTVDPNPDHGPSHTVSGVITLVRVQLSHPCGVGPRRDLTDCAAARAETNADNTFGASVAMAVMW